MENSRQLSGMHDTREKQDSESLQVWDLILEEKEDYAWIAPVGSIMQQDMLVVCVSNKISRSEDIPVPI
jgi:hypothetical protein